MRRTVLGFIALASLVSFVAPAHAAQVRIASISQAAKKLERVANKLKGEVSQDQVKAAAVKARLSAKGQYTLTTAWAAANPPSDRGWDAIDAGLVANPIKNAATRLVKLSTDGKTVSARAVDKLKGLYTTKDLFAYAKEQQLAKK